MAGTLKVDSINADSNLALKIANTAVAFIDATGLRPTSGNVNLDATATSKLYLPSANTVAIQTAGVTAVTVASSQNVTLAAALAVTGVTTVQAGTAALPAITTAGDTNTGIFFPAADTIAFAEGGAESMRIDSSGNLGIGTTSPNIGGYGANSRILTVQGVSGSYAIAELSSNSANSDGTFVGRLDFSSSGQAANYVNVASIASNLSGSTSTKFGSTLQFYTRADNAGSGSPSERMRIDSSGNVGIGTTNADFGSFGAGERILGVSNPTSGTRARLSLQNLSTSTSGVAGSIAFFNGSTQLGSLDVTADGATNKGFYAFNTNNGTSNSERMRIKSNGSLLVATTTEDVADANGVGATLSFSGNAQFSRASGGVVNVNRKTDDGILVYFQQDATAEGTISVSGTTVSYNGGHLSRYAQTTTAKDESLVKGTVLSNLDAMNVYTAPTTYWTEEDELPEGVNVGDVKVEAHEVANEQLNKVKVSDVEGDANVAGVFVNWSYDEQHSVDEINMAMTGDMIIRIAQGVTVQRGDLLMSAGDGTAKAQGDDIVRSKTIAKVTSNHVTCTYADGSYCVPCVLMAC